MHRFDLRALPFNRQTKFIFNDFNFFSMAHSVYIYILISNAICMFVEDFLLLLIRHSDCESLMSNYEKREETSVSFYIN